ncbi:MAG: DUF1549 domain-containing protein [Planctomycetaceae bacterium]
MPPTCHPRQRFLRIILIAAATVISAVSTAQQNSADDGIEFFEKRVRPILAEHCLHCHGPDEASGNLRLDSKSGWQRGGEAGPAIVPGDPAASALIRAVSYEDPELRMPPPDDGGRLSEQQIQDLVTWVRNGATDPRTGPRVVTDIEAAARDHWAFQPVQAPVVDSTDNPIDVLIERKLLESGMVPTQPADMKTLIRRAAFDLIGLPPTIQQLATPREQFPKLVQQLLASSRYGERWGRHWLDVARYSDAKDGVLMYGDARIRPFAYTYRDYVIRAFNDDKPFDRFIREQLAADQLDLPEDSPDLAAMGLLTLGRMFDGNRHDVIDDQIDVVTRGFQGLTVGCARCHDHKFDPVPTADYYSLYGVFASCEEPLERPRIQDISEAGTAFETEFNAKRDEVLAARQAHYDEVLQVARDRTPDYLVQVATTEPDISETTIFFLSLIPDQLRPQVTWRWRQLIARRAWADDSVFGPWHDMMNEPVLRPDEWRQSGVDQRIIDGLVAAEPKTPEQVARAYGNILRDVWLQHVEASRSESPPSDSAVENDPLLSLLLTRSGPVWFPIEDTARYLERQQADAFRGLVSQLDAIAVKHNDAAAASDGADGFRRPLRPGDLPARRSRSSRRSGSAAVFGRGDRPRTKAVLQRQRPAGSGQCNCVTRQSSDRARLGESRLDASLWSAACRKSR